MCDGRVGCGEMLLMRTKMGKGGNWLQDPRRLWEWGVFMFLGMLLMSCGV